MAKHIVKCKYCSQHFDASVEEYVKIKNRYAHKQCAEDYEKNRTQEDIDLENLEKYIMKLFDEPYINARIRKQMKEFKQTYKYTYSGMHKALIWWYEIKGNSTEKANGGIGIIPFIYDNARDYYYALYLAKIANENKDVTNYIPKQKEITIESPRVYIRPHRLFDLGEEENE